MSSAPETLLEATELIVSSLDSESRTLLLSVPQTQLVEFEEWSLGIRNSLGLWHNKLLLADCGSPSIHPDDATMVIMKAVWNRLNGLPIEEARKPGFRSDWECMKDAGPEAMYRRLRFRNNGKRHFGENILRKMHYVFPVDLKELQELIEKIEKSDAP